MAPFYRTHSNKALFSPQIFYFKTHYFVISEIATVYKHDFKKYFILINSSGNMAFVAVKHKKTLIFTCKDRVSSVVE